MHPAATTARSVARSENRAEKWTVTSFLRTFHDLARIVVAVAHLSLTSTSYVHGGGEMAMKDKTEEGAGE